MLVIFGAKDFQSGLTIIFKTYKLNGVLIHEKEGTEIDATGIYYCDVDVGAVRDCVCIAEDIGLTWKAFRYIGRT